MRVIIAPPEGVMARGIYYPINTDFSVWLEFARLMETGDRLSAARALKLCYRTGYPEDINEALSLLAEFFQGGASPEQKSGERLLSLTEDEELIYASFFKDYGIDLGEKPMHWWRFLALLKNLSPETPLMRVVAIRAAKPSEIKNSDQRRRLIRNKRLFALKKEPAEAGEVLAGLFEEVDRCQK